MRHDWFYMRRSVPMAIIFTIITCVIYALYWLYQLMSSLYHITGRRNTAGMDVILAFLTCGIYLCYLGYKMGKLESEAYQKYAKQNKDDSILYLIMNIFGLWIVTYAIMQSSINALVDRGDYGDGDTPHEESHFRDERSN